MALTLKFVFIGDAGAGKTAINHKFITGKFDENHCVPTIGAIFSCRHINLSVPVKIQLWDTSGQERFRSIVPMYYRGASAILLVFDISNRKSFTNIKDYWADQIKNENSFIIYLIGNKKDLSEKRQVSENEAQQLANDNRFKYYEISAKSDDLDPLLFKIVENIQMQIKISDIPQDKLKFYGVNLDKPQVNKKLSCCR